MPTKLLYKQLMTNMDKINQRILRALEIDGRMSNAELADKIGLSASACLRRVQELERTGVIKGYRAIIDEAAMDRGLTVFATVALSDHQKKSQRQFEKAMLKAEQVRECHNVTGSFEYILRIEVADLQTYKNFHTDVLGTVPLVSGITSYISMEKIKDARS